MTFSVMIKNRHLVQRTDARWNTVCQNKSQRYRLISRSCTRMFESTRRICVHYTCGPCVPFGTLRAHNARFFLGWSVNETQTRTHTQAEDRTSFMSHSVNVFVIVRFVFFSYSSLEPCSYVPICLFQKVFSTTKKTKRRMMLLWMFVYVFVLESTWR